MSLAPFDQSRIASYASRPDIARTWDAIQRAQGGELERLLVEAHLDDLLQITAMPANSGEAGERVREVTNVLAKRRNRQSFDAIRAGLERLDREAMQLNPSNLSFWGWYLPLQAEQAKQRNAGIVEAIVAHAGARGAITDAELRKRLTRYRLSDAELDQVANELAGSGIRVVGEVRSDVTRLIDAATAPNLVALLQPKAWQDGAEYSAYDAAITGRTPVTLADAERAIAFYDSRNDQRNKDAVVKVAAAAQSDQELRDLVLAYHLERMTSEEHIPAEVARGFVNAGLDPAEATKLQGGGTGSSVQASAGPVAGSDREHKIYQEIESLLEEGQLRAALVEHDRVVAAVGKPNGDYAKDVVLLLLGNTRRFEDLVAETRSHLKEKNLSAAQVSLQAAENIGADRPEMRSLRETVGRGMRALEFDRADQDYYSPALDAINNKDLSKARNILEVAKTNGAPSTSLGGTVLDYYQTASRDAAEAHARILDGLQKRDFWRAFDGVEMLEAVDLTSTDLAGLRGRVDDLGRDEDVIRDAIFDQGLGERTVAVRAQALAPAEAGPLLYLLTFFPLGLLVDLWRTENFSSPLAPAIAAVGVWFVQALVAWNLSTRGIAISILAFLISLVLWIGLALDGFYFTAIAAVLLYASGAAMRENHDTANELEDFVAGRESLVQQLRNDGLAGTTLELRGESFRLGKSEGPDLDSVAGRVIVRNAQGKRVSTIDLASAKGQGAQK